MGDAADPTIEIELVALWHLGNRCDYDFHAGVSESRQLGVFNPVIGDQRVDIPDFGDNHGRRAPQLAAIRQDNPM
jgi:hypothetical protein